MDAIEELFVPLCIYNNKPGKDAKVLARFKEASWNNPVTRIIGSDGKDRTGVNRSGWSVAAVAHQIIAAVKARGRSVPDYVALLSQESARDVETAVFGMT